MAIVYRCRKCKDFFKSDKIAQAKCEGCDFTTVRCKRCGGMAGALRSIMSHVRWFFHFGAYHENKFARLPHLKLLDGGRKQTPSLLRANARR